MGVSGLVLGVLRIIDIGNAVAVRIVVIGRVVIFGNVECRVIGALAVHAERVRRDVVRFCQMHAVLFGDAAASFIEL